MDLEPDKAETDWMAVAQQVRQTKEWETDIIMRIARRLAPVDCDIELMFGIFSRGERTCTHEDFKYCCLERLRLKDEISWQELDVLLKFNDILRDR